MDFDFFVQSIAEICEHSLVSPGRILNCTIVINSDSGGFTIRSRRKQHEKTLKEYCKKAGINPRRELSKKVEAVYTGVKGSVGNITETIINEAKEKHEAFYLIISAGGDGTHRDVMLALYNVPAHVRSNIAVLRLPLGTGNDGSDSASLAGALDLLINPVHIEFAPAVQLKTSPDGPASKRGTHLAFNILSVGLDAFVTHMTNKMKGKLPGDSYELWINIAALFYDRIYKVDFLDVKAFDQKNKAIHSFREKLLLLAMGVSGHRTYGSQEKILPDDRNVCGIKQMSFCRKLIIKGQVTKGKHTNNPKVLMFNANRLEFSFSHSILAQMDGEVIRLQPEDFPASMELTAPVIPMLKMLNNEVTQKSKELQDKTT